MLPLVFFAIGAVNGLRGLARDSDAVMGRPLLGLAFLVPAVFVAPDAAVLDWRAWQGRNRGQQRGA